MKRKWNYIVVVLLTIFIVGCSENAEDTSTGNETADVQEKTTAQADENKEEEGQQEEQEEAAPAVADEPEVEETKPNTNEDLFSGYDRIEVDGGDQNGDREANVVVDIGFGDREYWAFTNKHGQLVRVVAEEIILQDDDTEPVVSSGRYFWDEAQVPGVESDQLDQGHVIADSLGGVSNAYNITPQESTLNRHGDQAYMEDAIRDAGGATDFEAIITYPDTNTQIPSHYEYTYTIQGNEVVDTFDNLNPDDVNESLGLTGDDSTDSSDSNGSTGSTEEGDVSSVDANGNGQVTIQEAKDAGFSMPITSDHWLYQYMQDRDGDGMVGE
ncbi:DNA/RNA non-specific endonuclease [Halobacillus sp. GSS1]|uniref:DNA/RNA non-specific endonuclease n=1 Tax=Halobacillus sp. GSS1 TaxID=2815919 RepID=UPI001A8F95D4|nr:DNA/RNA non-specific endonuclease [Halobacillus sp. GSS1]MBN9654679.1 DNA/RNA non-specific endonuclease [Halobacillus sp. GSS1]